MLTTVNSNLTSKEEKQIIWGIDRTRGLLPPEWGDTYFSNTVRVFFGFICLEVCCACVFVIACPILSNCSFSIFSLYFSLSRAHKHTLLNIPKFTLVPNHPCFIFALSNSNEYFLTRYFQPMHFLITFR